MPDSPIQLFLNAAWEALAEIVKIGSDYPKSHPEHCDRYNALVGLLKDRSAFHAAEDAAVRLPGDALRLVRALDLRIREAMEKLGAEDRITVLDPEVKQALQAHDDLRPFATLTPRVNETKPVVQAPVALAAKKTKPRRRQRAPAKPRPLTEKQTEAMQLVGEHKGNVAAAARAIGRDSKTVRQHYKVALKKLGKEATKAPTTVRMPKDRRGQDNVSDDRRRA